MQTLTSRQQVPVHPFKGNGTGTFTIARSEGRTVIEPDMLLPHRKAYYLLVFVRQNQGRHWADLTPYEHRPHTVYFSEPGQILVKEEPTPFWGTHLEFTNEFLAQHADCALCPLCRTRATATSCA